MKLITDCETGHSHLILPIETGSRLLDIGIDAQPRRHHSDRDRAIGAENRARQRLDCEALQRNHQIGDLPVRRVKTALALRCFANGHQQAAFGDEFDGGQGSLCRRLFPFLHCHRGHTHHGVAAGRGTDRCGARESFTGARLAYVIAAGAALATASFCVTAGAIRRLAREYVPPAKELVVTVGTNATSPRECVQGERH